MTCHLVRLGCRDNNGLLIDRFLDPCGVSALPETPPAPEQVFCGPALWGFRRSPRTPPEYIWPGRSTRPALEDSDAPTFSESATEIRLGFAAVPPLPIGNPADHPAPIPGEAWRRRKSRLARHALGRLRVCSPQENRGTCRKYESTVSAVVVFAPWALPTP